MAVISRILSPDGRGRIFGLPGHFAEDNKTSTKNFRAVSARPVSPHINLEGNGLLAACSFLSRFRQKDKKLSLLLPPFLLLSGSLKLILT